MALEVVLVHRHGDGDAQREDGGYTVASQLERTGVSEGRSEGLLEFGVYLDVEDEVGGFRHSGLGWVFQITKQCHWFQRNNGFDLELA